MRQNNMKVLAQNYKKAKEQYGTMGFPMDIMAVDLNGGYVCMEDQTQESKESQEPLDETHQQNLNRFGLNI